MRIRGSIVDELRQNSPYSQKQIEGIKALQTAHTTLSHRLLREPTSAEWCGALNQKFQVDFAFLRTHTHHDVFFEEKTVEDEGDKLIDLCREMEDVYKRLSRREREVFDLLYGDQLSNKSLKQLAQELGVSVGTIKVFKSRLLKKFRTHLAQTLDISI